MNLGEAIGIYCAVAIFIILVFCLLTFFFHYQIYKENEQLINDQQNVENSQEKQNVMDDQMQQLIKNSLLKRFSMKSDKTNNHQKIQLADLRSPLQPDKNNIFKPPHPIDKIQFQRLPTLSSTKNQKKINTPQSQHHKMNVDNLRQNQYFPSKINRKSTMFRQPQNNDITKHHFTGKIVSYDTDRLQIVDNYVKSITKLNNKAIAQKIKIKCTIIRKQDSDFYNLLEAYGFEENCQSCYKFTTFLQIPNMKLRQPYLICNLYGKQTKQQISQQEYQQIKYKLYQQNPN